MAHYENALFIAECCLIMCFYTHTAGVCSPAGGSCDRATNSRYCGQALNGVRNLMTFAPICGKLENALFESITLYIVPMFVADCTGPFGVDVHFNNAADQVSITLLSLFRLLSWRQSANSSKHTCAKG